MLEELTTIPNWVCHNGDKVPRRIKDLQLANPVNPDDWASWEDACNFMRQKQGQPYGLGFVLTNDIDITCIDLDQAHTPEAAAWHKLVFETFDNTYAELSPSGKGLHIWCKGSIAASKKDSKRKIEMYSHARYMTVTFNAVRNLPLANYQENLDQLFMQLEAEDGINEHKLAEFDLSAFEAAKRVDTDKELIKKIRFTKHKELFDDLFSGKWEEIRKPDYSQRYESQSEADLAFVSILARYTDCVEQIKNIFWHSNLGKRDKARRPDYVTRTLKLAFMNRPTPEFKEESKQDEQEIQEAKEEQTDLAVEQVNWSKPPGLLGDIIEYIFYSSVKPNLEVSIASAIALMSAVCGRAYNTPTAAGLNQYVIIIGDSGVGKESVHRGMGKLLQAANEGNSSGAIKFLGPSVAASAPAIFRGLAEQPHSKLFPIGEMGVWLQAINAKMGTSENNTLLRKTYLELFAKSGKNDWFNGTQYSNSQKDIPPIKSPALTLLGDTTPEEFYKALDESNIAEGMISRFTTIHCPDGAEYKYNPNAGYYEIPETTKEKFKDLCEIVLRRSSNPTEHTYVVPETEEATEWQLRYQENCDRFSKQDLKNGAAKIWYRAHLRVMKIAALIAIGENPVTPVIDVYHYQWAQKLVETGVLNLIKRFESGQIGYTSNQVEQRNTTVKILKKYCNIQTAKEYSTNKKFINSLGCGRREVAMKIIYKGAFFNYVRQYLCFKYDKSINTSWYQLWKQFEDEGIVRELSMQQKEDLGIHNAAKAYFVDKKIL